QFDPGRKHYFGISSIIGKHLFLTKPEFSWCNDYHNRLTHGKSPVQSRSVTVSSFSSIIGKQLFLKVGRKEMYRI
ncbi:hypothetical protein C0J52_24160, partial [Blattella germanica]